MAVDVSGIASILPLLSFALVAIIVGAVLVKIELFGKNKWIPIVVSLIISSVFITAAGARTYIENIVPWFAILIVCLSFLLVLVGFVGKDLSFMGKGIGIGFVVVAIIGFVVAAIFLFSSYILPYLPGSPGFGGNLEVLFLTDWLYYSPVAGGILILIFAGLISLILIKGK